ncbi:MAG: alpha carbonic anhydrase [Olpidium bornovanus]|uniref:Carbonic anhydrase n=1 Tax=Olpidium bornovanus TaxID=278681 RepID=A0A8H7ZZC1_9FUNG|nr:MAG: alpha carbonic anhydrase [Olpidium bornovanus]
MLQSVLFLALVASSALAGPLSFAERQEKVDFGYEGNSGPNLWPGDCQLTGAGQSPINIREGSADAQTLPLPADLVAQPGSKLSNTGHSLDIAFDPAAPKASFVPAGQTEPFEVQGVHFHSPSEHRVNGKYFDAEMHIVAKSPAGTISVLGVFFEISENPQPNALLSALTAKVALSSPPSFSSGLPLNGAPATVDVDFDSIVQGTNLLTGFHSYTGSLTTPPCTTGVLWNVMDTPIPMSVAEALAIRNEIGFSARFTQVARDQEPVFSPPNEGLYVFNPLKEVV